MKKTKFFRILPIAAVLAVCALFVSCAEPLQGGNQPITQCVWIPYDHQVENAEIRIYPDGRVKGSTGRNVFIASIRYNSDDRLRFDSVYITKHDKEITPYEKELIHTLNKARYYRCRGGRLAFYDSKGREMMRFIEKPKTAADDD